MKALVADFSLGREVWDRFRSKFARRKNGPGGLTFNFVEIPEPTPISSQWVKVRTIMSGISDMDEGMVNQSDPSPFGAFVSFPFVPGNENLGIVTETGAEVEGIEPGDRVVADPLLSCVPRGIEPVCPSCEQGNPSWCLHFDGGVLSPGIMIGACKDTSGGWADCFIAHMSQLRVVPQSLESNEAILLPLFARALRAVLQHPPRPASTVVIVGAGALGLLTLHAIQLLQNDAQVIIVAEHEFEADVARMMGGSELVLSHGPGTTYEEVAALFGATVRYPEVGRLTMQGGAELVYETTGQRSLMEDAVRFTGEGKKLVLMAINQHSGFDMTPLWFKGVEIRGTIFSGRETFNGRTMSTFDVAMELAAEHGLPFQRLVTHKFQPAQHAQAFAALADRSSSKAVKVVFEHVV